tara:strand:+ start:359 stop:622 length:264 start_codon:yes stop_codon:yes gene_type:complete
VIRQLGVKFGIFFNSKIKESTMDEQILDNLNKRLEKTINDTETVLEEPLKLDVEELKDQVESIVREHPIKSVLVSFGVGYLLSRLFK